MHLGVEGEVAELRLRERVDLRRGVLARRELAEHHGKKLRVGQLLEGKALQAVVAIRVHDAARRHIVPDYGNLSRFVEAESGLRGRLLDVACARAGKGRERFGRIGLLLCTAKGGDVGFDCGDTLVVELAFHLGQAGGRGIVVIGGLVNGHNLRVGRMVAFQEHLADQLLEVALVELLAQAFERILVAQIIERGIVVVEPASHARAGERHAVGDPEVLLAHHELGMRESSRHHVVVERAVRKLRKHSRKRRSQALAGAFLKALRLHDGKGLQHGVGHVGHDVAGEVLVEQCALRRRLIRAEDRVEQDVHRDHALPVGGSPRHKADRTTGVLGRRLHGRLVPERRYGRLQLKRVRRVLGARFGSTGREIALVEEGEEALGIHVPVEHDLRVGQVVVAAVGVEELLVGKRRDGGGLAARLEAVCRVGEQRRRKLVVENRLGVGERAFHLVVHHAVVGELARAFIACKLHMPAFLLEDCALVEDGGVQHSVEIDVHEVQKILLVGARHRVDRLVGVGHGVQERLHRAFEQVHEGLFHGELVRAAKHRVLEDMKDARVVGGRCLEGDRERLVRVVVLQVEQLRARGVVVEHIGSPVDFGQVGGSAHSEPVHSFTGGKFHRTSFSEGLLVRLPLSHNAPRRLGATWIYRREDATAWTNHL